MNCHSCVRQLLEGLHSARAPPRSLLLKTCPLFPYTNNYGHSLSHTLRASHNFSVFRVSVLTFKNICKLILITLKNSLRGWWQLAFEHIQVCVFSCYWQDVMKTISSLALGHGSDEDAAPLRLYHKPRDYVEASVCHVKDLENGQ